MKDWKKFLYILTAFLACFYLPVENIRFNNAIFVFINKNLNIIFNI